MLTYQASTLPDCGLVCFIQQEGKIMGKEQETRLLSQSVEKLIAQFNDVNVYTLDNINVVRDYLTDIDTVRLQVTQYRDRFSDNSWRPWGIKIWSKIELIDASLKVTLNHLERKETQSEKVEQREHEDNLLADQRKHDYILRAWDVFLGIAIGLIIAGLSNFFFLD